MDVDGLAEPKDTIRPDRSVFIKTGGDASTVEVEARANSEPIKSGAGAGLRRSKRL